MKQQLIRGLLIIALVGQALLTPAMAMPSFLHAASHQHSELAEPLPDDVWSPQGGVTELSQTNSKHCDTPNAHAKVPQIDCDALCEMLSSGNCLTHCASASAMLLHNPMSLAQPSSHYPLVLYIWYAETAYLAPIHRPPITV